MEIDESRIVARGIWLYDGTVPCQIIIQKEDVWPAFYDPQDDPDADDKVMPCVSVWYENPGGGYTFEAGGGYYHTVEEAKAAVEKVVPGPVQWQT
jgi:hypothetical protein